MSAYIYAIIPYKSGISFDDDELFPFVCDPILPQLDCIQSQFTKPDGLMLYKDFLLINTCLRQSVFTNNRDGYNLLRADIYAIAKALEANEVWYVEELVTDEIDEPNFSFEEWKKSLIIERAEHVAELTQDILKGKDVFSYYHDDFSDIMIEK